MESYDYSLHHEDILNAVDALGPQQFWSFCSPAMFSESARVVVVSDFENTPSHHRHTIRMGDSR